METLHQSCWQISGCSFIYNLVSTFVSLFMKLYQWAWQLTCKKKHIKVIYSFILITHLILGFLRAVQSLLSMPWPTMYNVSQQLGACMGRATSRLQTTLPAQRHWLLSRRMQRWQQLQHMGDTQGMLCHKPSLQQPSSCLSMMCTRHIDCACD